MKIKHVIYAIAIVATLGFVSACKGSSSGPEATAEKAMASIMNNDMKGFLDCFNLSSFEKTLYVGLFEGFGVEMSDFFGEEGTTISGYEIGDINLDEANNTAKLTIKMKLSNGEEAEEEFPFIKEKGKWYLDKSELEDMQ